MPVTHYTYQYNGNFVPVLATALGLRSPRGCNLDPAYFSQSIGARGIVQKNLPPGTFAAAIPNSALCRALPRTQLVAASATNSPTLLVTPHTSQFFVPGDVLQITEPFLTATLAGTWLANDTLTISVEGRAWTYTVPTPAPASLTLLAADIAAKMPLSAISDLANAYSAAAVLTLLSGRDRPSAVAFTVVSTAGTISPASGTMALGAAIGTVSAVTVDPLNNVYSLTLAANAAAVIPVGASIGDLRFNPAGLGMMNPNVGLDLLWDNNTMQACFTAASVYGARLPHWDAQLARLFPEITLA